MVKKKKSKKAHYLDNKEFERVIKAYLIEPDENVDRLVELLDLLITNIIHTFKFKVDPDDAKQECFVLAFKILKNFTPKKGSAFNYFTTVFVNNMKLMYTKNKKYYEKIQKFQAIKENELRDYISNLPKTRE